MKSERLKHLYARIKENKYINKYTITLGVFVIYIVFFDGNSLLHRYDTHKRQKEVNKEIVHYQQEIEENKALLDALGSDTETLERFAREHYKMKRPNEDVYIVRE